jgi:hypothetical protein
MSRLSLDFGSTRSEESMSRTLTLRAGLTVDLDWLQSERLHRNVLTGICLALVLLAFAVSLGAALRLKMHSEVPYWVYAAVPPALSRVEYGHDRYMSLNFVNDTYYAALKSSYAKDVNSAIATVLDTHLVVPDYKSQIVNQADDKGIVVLTEISFRVFGYRIEGVLYMYYIILGLSAALFAFSYRRNPHALLLLASFLFLHRLIMPMIKYDGQLGGITALRCMPVLAMIACMHSILFLFESRVDGKKIAVLILQVALMVFVMHIRSTTMWELALVAGVSLMVLLWRKGPVARQSTRLPLLGNRWPASVPLGAVIVLVLLLNAHRNYGFPEEYHRNGDAVTRPFWHNIYSGFAFHPAMAERYQLKVDDFTVLLATKQYLIENNRADVWEAVGGNSSNFTGMRWKAYDDAVREMLIARCRKHFNECLTTLVYYKPLSMIKNVLWVTGWVRLPPDLDIFVSKFPEIGNIVKEQFIETTRQLDRNKERGRKWLRYMAAMIAAFAVLAWLRPRKDEVFPVLATAAILAAGSTVPSIVGYPAPHTIAEAALAIPLLVVVLFCGFAIWLRRGAPPSAPINPVSSPVSETI